MAGTLNAVFLVARLSRDPEVHNFPSGASVTKVGLVVDDRKKNPQTGQWEESPVWISAEAFASADGKGPGKVLADYAQKGKQIAVRGKLKLDQWEDKTTGQKRSELRVVIEEVTLLGSKNDGPGEAPAQRPTRQATPQYDEPPLGGGDDDNLPF